MGTKNGQFSKADTSEPFKRVFLIMCCAIRYLNCLLAWEIEDHSIALIAIFLVKIELIENKDLYLLSGEKTKQFLFMTKDKLVKLS